MKRSAKVLEGLSLAQLDFILGWTTEHKNII